MLGSRPLNTPMDPNQKLGVFEYGCSVDKGSSQCLVGKLIYLPHTRPDISFGVSVISQFMILHVKNIEAAYRILKYLKRKSKERSIL